MADLIVITGPPGAGKSTVAALLADRFAPSALVQGDDFFALIKQGYIAPWTSEANEQNAVIVAAAAAAAGRLVKGGYTVVYDGVIGPWFREAFGLATGLSEMHYAMLLPAAEVCIERVQSRVGHGFNDLEAAAHMHQDFASSQPGDGFIISTPEPAHSIAASIYERVNDGSLRWPIDQLN